MTALADALRAAQAQTLAAMSRAYIAGHVDGGEGETAHEAMAAMLDAIGCSDRVEQTQLLAALDALRGFGVQGQAAAPAKGSAPASEAATPAQMRYAQDLADKAKTTLPGYPLTAAQASKIIEELKAGKYSADSWEVPF